MRIVEAIEQADELYPNNYSQEEKLRWCYELTVMLYEKFKKCYRALEFEGGEGFVLPSYIMGAVSYTHLDVYKRQMMNSIDFESYKQKGDYDLGNEKDLINYKYEAEN